MLAHLYRQCETQEDLRYYYAGFNSIKNLVMWKAQFLSETLLIIKFGQPEYIIGRVTDSAQSIIAYYVFYDMDTSEILGIFNNSCNEFLSTFYYDLDCFHERSSSGVTDDGGGSREAFITNSSNCLEERQELLTGYINVAVAKHGGSIAAARKALSALPLPFQCLSISPYFDSSLFSYDTKHVSFVEKPKQCPDYPIKFFDRRDGKFLFDISLGITSDYLQSLGKVK